MREQQFRKSNFTFFKHYRLLLPLNSWHISMLSVGGHGSKVGTTVLGRLPVHHTQKPCHPPNQLQQYHLNAVPASCSGSYIMITRNPTTKFRTTLTTNCDTFIYPLGYGYLSSKPVFFC